MSEEMTGMVENQDVDTSSQENAPAGHSSDAPKEQLFTDAYVKGRIDKQRAKYETQLGEKDARIAELEEQAKEASAKAEALEHEKQLAEWAAKASKETGIDASVIRGATEEEMLQHAQAIKASISVVPKISDSGAPAPTTMSKDDISKITNDRDMLAAIKASLGE